MARVRSSSATRKVSLSSGWSFAEVASDAATDPRTLDALAPSWSPAEVPGTVASALRALGAYTLGDAKSFDIHDYWYKTFVECAVGEDERVVLHFEGLATIADVWVDGAHVLSSDSMWQAHALDLTGRIRASSELVVRFASLDKVLAARRQRPRYKTRMVRKQELRFVRTTLLGRMPGWSPPVAPVGPFRSIWLEIGGPAITADLRTSVDGTKGRLALVLQIGGRVDHAELRACGLTVPLTLESSHSATTLRGLLEHDDVPLWWPHTHGPQPLHDVSVHARIDGVTVVIELGRVGFRRIEVDESPGGRGFGLVVNQVPVFARGATFTPLDVVSLGGTEATYRRALEQVLALGMNMIRLSGTLVYEPDLLFDLCDELGILVWQDFMFANLDYPRDEAFMASAKREGEDLLSRIQTSPALAVLCGGSEVAQQASMLGLGPEAWQPELFEGVLSELSSRLRPDVPYVPSTPWGGALPFRTNVGVTHYYGVGAYERGLDDARRADVKFAAECLAFSNVPSPRAVDALLAGGESPAHHPRWKERVPRDHGSGWDFEDVRDHYVKRLFGVDPAKVRYSDVDRYLALGRATTGEIMASVFSEWRQSETTRGALVWLLRDLWPGAGFGLVTSDGAPKSCFYALARVLAPVAILVIDEGLNGVRFVAVNDHAAPVLADLEVVLYLRSNVVRRATKAIELSPRQAASFDVEELLGSFVDPAHAYRFGPPTCDLVVGRLRSSGDARAIATAFHFPLGYSSEIDSSLVLSAIGLERTDGTLEVIVTANRLATSVVFDVRGYVPDDEGFHVEPGASRSVLFRSVTEGDPVRTLTGSVRSLNCAIESRIHFAARESR